MHLRSVQLINWRSYRSQMFEFPRPDGYRNVVLVKAPNEYGKTSFFEAVTLGLFGVDGLILVPRARTATGKGVEDRITATYSRFLQDALHRRALEDGTPECVVKLEWEDERGERIEIKRTWHFNWSGLHKIADDQLLIYEGRHRAPVGPPPTVANKDRWYREWIAGRFITPSLAEFFLFDGEQVQRYATRDMRDQVRNGIEGLLGLPILRGLKDSLEKYAQNRRTRAAPSDKTVRKVKIEIDEILDRISKKKMERDVANAHIPGLDEEIEELTRRLGGRRESTTALIASLLEDESRHESEAQRAADDLMELIAGDIALAVAGPLLRERTIARLRAEEKRESWEAGRNEGVRNLDRFVADLSGKIRQIDPPIDFSRHEAILDAAQAAWDALWHPPPDGCADEYLHVALNGTKRAQVIDRLAVVDRHSATATSALVERFHRSVATARDKKMELLELERMAPEVEEKTRQLKEKGEQSGRFKEQRDAAQREIDSADALLKQKRAELARYTSGMARGASTLRYAERADAYAKLIGDLLTDAMPILVGEVATEMTRAWKAMAHMPHRLKRIEISENCDVKMLTADGSDLHQVEKSAGASQVFTQALIKAITDVSGRVFPFIVDTPLARLSLEQRLGVLKAFTDRSGQVILLSTDQEVVDDKLDAIRGRLSGVYELNVTQDKDVPVTTARRIELDRI